MIYWFAIPDVTACSIETNPNSVLSKSGIETPVFCNLYSNIITLPRVTRVASKKISYFVKPSATLETSADDT